ncbi:unnamed protein product [Colias eurytheme]|nr:unnamed protein product [Colias eurytheme]
MVISDLFHSVLRRDLPKLHGICCMLIVSGFEHNKFNNFRDGAVCKQPECNIRYRFKGQLINLKAKILIYSTNDKPNHTVPLAYSVSKTQREVLRERLRFAKPNTVRKQLVSDMDTDLAQNEHNHQFATSLDVLQKIKSENNLKNNRHNDDSVDVMLRMIEAKQNHPYIKKFSTPFTTYLGINEQIELLKAHKDLSFHFDATGSLVRKPDKKRKRVKASARSGAGTAEIHVPKLWYYSEMFFLADVDVPRVTRSVNSILDDMPFEDSAERQRIGRLGRTRSGIYLRPEDVNALDDFSTEPAIGPEIILKLALINLPLTALECEPNNDLLLCLKQYEWLHPEAMQLCQPWKHLIATLSSGKKNKICNDMAAKLQLVAHINLWLNVTLRRMQKTYWEETK